MTISLLQAVSKVLGAFSERITASLKDLLENKHLYQNVNLDYKDLIQSVLKVEDIRPDSPLNLEFHFIQRVVKRWYPEEAGRYDASLLATDTFFFRTPDVKLFCSTCERVEAFNSVSTEDFLGRGTKRDTVFRNPRGPVQVFALSFLCQACKTVPEVFIVSRDGFKFVLSGRSPIEHIEVPSFLPKNIHKYYSGALVAHQSGQTLAGLFLLRTLIEQWAQSRANVQGLQADQALESYMATLPDDFKDRFPSLRAIYGDISVDLHKAEGSSELFEKARDQIVEHFEARRLYKIT